MKRVVLYASALALLAGCSKEMAETNPAPVKGKSIIYATYEVDADLTRTIAIPDGNNGYNLKWELGDHIGVFDAEPGDKTNEDFAYTGSEGVFYGDKGYLFGQGYVAYYPYRENHQGISSNGDIQLRIPSEQKHRTNAGEVGSFGQNIAPAVAYGKASSDDRLHLTFRPVATYMRVPIIGEGTIMTLTLRIKKEDGRYVGLAGEVNVNISDIIKNVSGVAPAAGDYKETAITLTCHKDGKGGVELDKNEPQYFWFVIPGGLMLQNETVEITVNGGWKLTRKLSYSSPQTTKVNGAIVMGQGVTTNGEGKSVPVPFEWNGGKIPEDMERAFPDPIFREYVLNNFDGDGDGKISQEEALVVTNIDVTSTGIASLEGVQYFVNLESLRCNSNRLTSVDVSNNPALEYLDCDYNQLTSLDVSNNPALEHLTCHYNQLTSLDVSNNPALEYLTCSWNQLTSLDVSNNPALEYLSCGRSSLTSLDVSNNPALVSLGCSSNWLTSLDVSNNPALEHLICNYNELTSVDVSNNPALRELSCSENQLTSVDVSNNPALESLYCESTQLTSVDVSNNPALEYLWCSYNQLTSLDVSNNPALKHLRCDYNELTSLDVSNNPALELLWCFYNQLTSLDVSNNPALIRLLCSYNQLTSVDVSNNPALDQLTCHFNQLTSVDVSNNPALEFLWCSDNQLTSVDVSNNLALEYLNCSYNQLTSVDVSNNPALGRLNCGYNQLTSVDVSNNLALEYLDCSWNQLTSLDVSMTNLGNGHIKYPHPLECNMSTLETLYLKTGWEIPGITPDRDANYISDQTEIVFINGLPGTGEEEIL